MKGRLHHFVPGEVRLQEYTTTRGPRTDETGGAYHERHCLLCSPVPRREQLVIEVHEHHRGRRTNTVQHRLGPEEYRVGRGRRHRVVRCVC